MLKLAAMIHVTAVIRQRPWADRHPAWHLLSDRRRGSAAAAVSWPPL